MLKKNLLALYLLLGSNIFFIIHIPPIIAKKELSPEEESKLQTNKNNAARMAKDLAQVKQILSEIDLEKIKPEDVSVPQEYTEAKKEFETARDSIFTQIENLVGNERFDDPSKDVLGGYLKDLTDASTPDAVDAALKKVTEAVTIINEQIENIKYYVSWMLKKGLQIYQDNLIIAQKVLLQYIEKITGVPIIKRALFLPPRKEAVGPPPPLPSEKPSETPHAPTEPTPPLSFLEKIRKGVELKKTPTPEKQPPEESKLFRDIKEAPKPPEVSPEEIPPKLKDLSIKQLQEGLVYKKKFLGFKLQAKKRDFSEILKTAQEIVKILEAINQKTKEQAKKEQTNIELIEFLKKIKKIKNKEIEKLNLDLITQKENLNKIPHANYQKRLTKIEEIIATLNDIIKITEGDVKTAAEKELQEFNEKKEELKTPLKIEELKALLKLRKKEFEAMSTLGWFETRIIKIGEIIATLNDIIKITKGGVETAAEKELKEFKEKKEELEKQKTTKEEPGAKKKVSREELLKQIHERKSLKKIETPKPKPSPSTIFTAFERVLSLHQKLLLPLEDESLEELNKLLEGKEKNYKQAQDIDAKLDAARDRLKIAEVIERKLVKRHGKDSPEATKAKDDVNKFQEEVKKLQEEVKKLQEEWE